MNLMREGQCSLTFEDYVEGLTDNETFIPVHAIILGIVENTST